MVKKIKDRLPKRKVNVFLICLICSFMAWLVSKLSETRTDITSFELLFLNVPDSLMQNSSQRRFVDAEVRASGFQFLRFYLGKEKLKIDLSQLQAGVSGYFLPREDYQPQVENQLPGNMQLVALTKPNLAIDFISVHARKVPVFADVTLNLDKDHLLEGPLVVKPDSILIKGPGPEIDSIKQLRTQAAEFKNLNASFSRELPVFKPDALKHAILSPRKVTVSGTVSDLLKKSLKFRYWLPICPKARKLKHSPIRCPCCAKRG